MIIFLNDYYFASAVYFHMISDYYHRDDVTCFHLYRKYSFNPDFNNDFFLKLMDYTIYPSQNDNLLLSWRGIIGQRNFDW